MLKSLKISTSNMVLSSHIQSIFETHPLMSLSEHGGAGEVYFKVTLSPIRRGSAPSGAAAFIMRGNMEVSALHHF